MEIKPKIGILTTFGGSDSAYSLVNVVATQLKMLIDNGYYPVLFVCPSFTGTGIWADNHIEIRRTIQSDAKSEDIMFNLQKVIDDIDVMICHDIVFLSQHVEWAEAVRRLAHKERFSHIRWLHWQHSRGDHSPITPIDNSEFCYPNKGDLGHVKTINSTTDDRVHYVPHPLDFAYLGWPELAIRIAEDYDFPFVDISMIYPTRLDRQKQVEKAIRVFSGLKKAGKSICLLVADAYATGQRFKEYKEDCLAIAKEQGLTDKEFVFLGEVYEECVVATPRAVVKALYEMSNIFIQVSNSETSSLVVMEASLAGNLIILNADFPPIHHLYGKALAIPFSSVIHPDTKYYRHIRTVDGSEIKVEDPQLFFDDQARNTIIPILDGQIVLSVKKQQLRDRWPTKVFKDYLEPLLLKDWSPKDNLPKCEGDPEVTAIICTLDNLPMLQRQLPVMMKEVGRVIVVNNGSKDGTKEWLEENPIRGVDVINLDENKGAGIGRNAGLRLWDENRTPYTLMIDGGILPPMNGVKPMKDYLIRHPEATSISPEIASCYTTDEAIATLVYSKDTIDDCNTFQQKSLSGTAYGLYKAEKWVVRFNEDGPYGEPGWGVDDNDMAYRWRDLGLIHIDFVSEQGMILFRRASGSYQRLFDETGIWPNQYGSVYEKRLVKLNQDYPHYQNQPPEVSCVVLGWNEYPMIAKVVKGLHDELADVNREIIVIDNGSTDGTKEWCDRQRYRQHWGDTTIDTNGEIIRRSPENEEYWTGNFRVHRFEKNVGTGIGFNKGFEMAKGQYIFYICGDCLVRPKTIKAFLNYLKEHPDVYYIGANAWMNESDLTKELLPFEQLGVLRGLGNYAYSYALVRREVWDSGVRFSSEGPFDGPGAGYEEMEFAYGMSLRKMKAELSNDFYYYHQRRDGERSGVETREDGGGGIDERKKYIQTKWTNTSFEITHYYDYSGIPDRHIRKIAMMNNLYEGNPGPAGFLAMALRKIGCEVDCFNSLDVPPEKEKYDNFIFVDDGDNQHWTCPEWAHPSIYWCIDMYNPSCFPYSPPEHYMTKLPTFDQVCSISKSAVDYCIQNNLQAFHVPHAGNEDYHRPFPESKVYDWVAIWSNYGDRATYSNAALEKFPNGLLGAGLWGDEYPRHVSMGKCAISKARGYEYPARVVETMMIGTPLVSFRDKYLDMFFVENEHYLGFSSVEEMLEKIQWVLDNPTEASDMSERARKLVLREHRYYHRALRMISGW